MEQHLYQPPPPLPAAVPADLRQLVLRMLAKPKARRPAMAEVAAFLRARR